MKRKQKLVNGEVYHIFSRSIANFTTFNNPKDFERMIELLQFYQIKEPPTSFSTFMKLELVKNIGFQTAFTLVAKEQEKIVQIIAYCLMPTHVHFILKQLQETGISNFMGNILNSYSRHFNLNYRRKGPLWESKFQNILVENDELLLHLTRYLHLNPVTAFLVDEPRDWRYSSFGEYVENADNFPICQFKDLMEIKPKSYQRFVEERINYQRELAKIKNLLLE